MAKRYCIFMAYNDPGLGPPGWADILYLWRDLTSIFTVGEDVIITGSANNNGAYNIDAMFWQIGPGFTEIEIPPGVLTDIDPFPWTNFRSCPSVHFNPSTSKVIYNPITKKIHWNKISLFGYGEPEP